MVVKTNGKTFDKKKWKAVLRCHLWATVDFSYKATDMSLIPVDFLNSDG